MRFPFPALRAASFSSFAGPSAKARQAALSVFAVALLLSGGVAAVRGQSALDGFDPNANANVYAVVVQPDGKILIGGDFTTVLGVTRERHWTGEIGRGHGLAAVGLGPSSLFLHHHAKRGSWPIVLVNFGDDVGDGAV